MSNVIIMMKKNSHYYIRKSHRYLGLLIGIRFLLWTVGGLYFSRSELEEIHGDHLTKRATGISLLVGLVSPQRAIEALKQTRPVDSLYSLQLVQVTASAEYLEATGPQHEYWGKPLPAWAVRFEHPSQATVSVLGLITLLSGFILYYITSPTVRKLGRKRRVLKTNQP